MGRDPGFLPSYDPWKMTRLAAAVVVGLVFGVLVVIPPYLPLPANFQKLVWVLPFVFVLVALFKNMERLVLFLIAISVPLNLDVSVIISPYARNAENIARGFRTIISLTELRLSLVFIVLVMGYALWLLKPRTTEKRQVRFFAGTSIPALGLIFISILSGIQAMDTQLWLFRIAQLIEVFLAYFYLANHIQSIKDMQFFVVVSLCGMLVESLLMIVQWITGLTFQIAGLEATVFGPGRIGGTLGHTGPTAGYLSALILVACGLIWGFPQKAHKNLAFAGIVLGVIALVSTGSRIGWIGFGLTMLAFILVGFTFGWVKRDTLIILFLVVIALGTIFSGQIYNRFTANDYGSAESRPMMWRQAWNVIRGHPWLGVGAGNYALVNWNYFTPEVGNPNEVFDKQVHNAYLSIWAESGFFALLCYLGLLGAAVKQAWMCAYSKSRFVSLLGIGLSLGIVSLCIQMVTGTFHTRAITLFVWLLVAMAASLPSLRREPYAPAALS